MFAEEVGFGLFCEGRFEDAGAGAADAFGVGEGPGEGVAAGILLDGYECGDAAAFGEDFADSVTGGLGGDERNVDAGGAG